MPNSRKLYVDGEFGQIHLRFGVDRGDGSKPTLLCLHQSPKSSLEFETFIHAASRDRAVIAADYPGYGMSDAPPSEDVVSIGMYARNMWAVLDATGAEKVDLFGNHTGSKVAVEMALQQPERVRGIAMVSAAILTDEERAMFSDMFTPIPLDEEMTRLKTGWQRILERRVEGVSLEWMDRSLYQNMMGGEAYEWGHAAAFAYGAPFDKALADLPHRKIILNPADDLQECTRRATAIMTNGEVIECPQWGYGFLDYHPEAVCDLILPRLDAA
ncbi:MAG: alpha/beta fold hydrolase [Pseudomonadota bacterium]